jgi:predicted hydrocarbon binding protein
VGRDIAVAVMKEVRFKENRELAEKRKRREERSNIWQVLDEVKTIENDKEIAGQPTHHTSPCCSYRCGEVPEFRARFSFQRGGSPTFNAD